MCGTLGVPDRLKAIELHNQALIRLGILECMFDILMWKSDTTPFEDFSDECVAYVESRNPDCRIDVRLYIQNIINREGAVGCREVNIVLYDESDRLSAFANSLLPLVQTVQELVV